MLPVAKIILPPIFFFLHIQIKLTFIESWRSFTLINDKLISNGWDKSWISRLNQSFVDIKSSFNFCWVFIICSCSLRACWQVLVNAWRRSCRRSIVRLICSYCERGRSLAKRSPSWINLFNSRSACCKRSATVWRAEEKKQDHCDVWIKSQTW